jgi:hypothetical protein
MHQVLPSLLHYKIYISGKSVIVKKILLLYEETV